MTSDKKKIKCAKLSQALKKIGKVKNGEYVKPLNKK